VKLRDLERHLSAHGALKVTEGGKHTKWRSADRVRATAVPRHSEIGPGLVRAICRQLDIPPP
jgi:mRNA interferase HicA